MRLLCSAMVLVSLVSFGQVPDTLNFEPPTRDTTCRAVASRMSVTLSTLKYTQTQEIADAIAEWESRCPESEPLLRAKILLELQQRKNADELVQRFIPRYYTEYRLRVSEWVYLEVYDDDRARFGYVPFESAFDEWTEEWALQLIDGIRYGTDEFLACALFTSNIDRFDEMLSSGDFNETYTWRMMDETSKNRWDPLATGSFHVGYWQPAGTLSKSFGGTVDLGVSIGMRINRTSGVRVEAVLKLRPMVNKDGLTLVIEPNIVETKSGVCFTAGGQIIKSMPVKEKFTVDLGGGIEYLVLSTKEAKPSNPPNFEEIYYTIETYNVFGRAAIRKLLSSGGSAGLYASWNYAPFDVDPDLGRSIGDVFITVGLEFRPRGK